MPQLQSRRSGGGAGGLPEATPSAARLVGRGDKNQGDEGAWARLPRGPVPCMECAGRPAALHPFPCGAIYSPKYDRAPCSPAALRGPGKPSLVPGPTAAGEPPCKRQVAPPPPRPAE